MSKPLQIIDTEKVLYKKGIEKLQEEMEKLLPNTIVNVKQNLHFWVIPDNIKAMKEIDKYRKMEGFNK